MRCAQAASCSSRADAGEWNRFRRRAHQRRSPPCIRAAYWIWMRLLRSYHRRLRCRRLRGPAKSLCGRCWRTSPRRRARPHWDRHAGFDASRSQRRAPRRRGTSATGL